MQHHGLFLTPMLTSSLQKQLFDEIIRVYKDKEMVHI